MRRDPYEKFQEDLKEKARNTIDQTEDEESYFSEPALNQFFNNPIWVAIEESLAYRQTILLSDIFDPSSVLGTEVLHQKKGQFVELIYLRAIRQILEKPKETDDE